MKARLPRLAGGAFGYAPVGWSRCVAAVALLIGAGCLGAPHRLWGQDDLRPTYQVFVANESSDVVSRVAFTPGEGARVVSETPVGIVPTELEAPHGLAVSPDGRYWYVSLAHGMPFGRVWKWDVEADTLAGWTQLGMFPATMDLSPDGRFLFAVNFNLHGDRVPSSVSVVYTSDMIEIARLTTCIMPHGSRVNQAGDRHFSACMHSEQVVAIDTRSFRVVGRFRVAPGQEGPLPLDDLGWPRRHTPPDSDHVAVCAPTWAEPGRGAWARFVYVTCNRGGTILEIDAADWRLSRRIEVSDGPYNLATTPEGRLLVVTLKNGQAIAILDLSRGEIVARVSTTRPITHGAVVSPDGRYAFVTNEAIGGQRGTVDVISLERFELAASVEVGLQPGGIAFLLE
ncbi:MAG: YncE family protein [Gemmatimonadota bacterium]|nr:MAG: YncE family protein [Gemmatimonadota bacterium]